MTVPRRILLLVLLLLPLVAFAKPLLGFAVSFKTAGLFSRTLTQADVVQVRPGSPAEKAGLKVGDHVLELNGIRVQGADGSELQKKLAATRANDHVSLKVDRPGKGLLVIDVVAGS